MSFQSTGKRWAKAGADTWCEILLPIVFNERLGARYYVVAGCYCVKYAGKLLWKYNIGGLEIYA